MTIWSVTSPSLSRRTLIALVAIALAVTGRALIEWMAPGVVPFVLTFPAVILAGLLGGWLSGLLTIAGCQLLVWYFIIPPARSFELLSFADGISLLLSNLSQLAALAAVVKYREAHERHEREIAARTEFFRVALHELDHRTNNNFMLAASLLNAKASAAAPDVATELRGAASRLMSVAGTYKHLTSTSETLSEVRLEAYLDEICAQLREGLVPPDVTLGFSGEPMIIDAHQAVHIGLVMNEWITNAVKYAFPEGGGAIEVELARQGDQGVLVVRDDGVGATLSGKGTGSRLVELLARSIHATVGTEARNGTHCRLTFSLG